jgi:hypothetical protein
VTGTATRWPVGAPVHTPIGDGVVVAHNLDARHDTLVQLANGDGQFFSGAELSPPLPPPAPPVRIRADQVQIGDTVAGLVVDGIARSSGVTVLYASSARETITFHHSTVITVGRP